MRRRDAAASLLLGALGFWRAPWAAAQGASLFAQSVRKALAPVAPGTEFVLLSLPTQEILANTFLHPDSGIPPGSLLKPFVALAYAGTHAQALPTVVCRGHADHCWQPGGHGPMTLTPAIAHSCNAYFLELARRLSAKDVEQMPLLPPPPTRASPETLIGLTPEWRIRPQALARAYAELVLGGPRPGRAEVVAGMRASAANGTALRIGRHPGGVLAKTGTAPCADRPCQASGDGLVLAMAPAGRPAVLLLVRRHGTTGAMTAVAAGDILRRLESLHAG